MLDLYCSNGSSPPLDQGNIDLGFCPNGSSPPSSPFPSAEPSPPSPPPTVDSSNPSQDEKMSYLVSSQMDHLYEKIKKRYRKMSYLGYHPETIQREIEAETAILAQVFFAAQLSMAETNRFSSVHEVREEDDLKLTQIEENRFYSIDQVEKSFKGVVNLESLRKNGMVSRGGWTLGSSLKRALDQVFRKEEVAGLDFTGGNYGTKDQAPRLCSRGSEKRMADNVGGPSKSGSKVHGTRNEARDMENELANLRRLRARKSPI